MVVLDSTVDLIVFSGMVLGWAKEARGDEVVHRLGASHLVVQLVKLYVGTTPAPQTCDVRAALCTQCFASVPASWRGLA